MIPLIENEGLCGSVYTQLSDVEGEMNGLITYDRAVCKLPSEALLEVNKKIYEAFEKARKEK